MYNIYLINSVATDVKAFTGHLPPVSDCEGRGGVLHVPGRAGGQGAAGQEHGARHADVPHAGLL